jgi:hypothetical protein
MEKRHLKIRPSKRTTLTLEADVMEAISQKLAQNPKLKEKQVVNDYIRKGIQFEALSPPQLFKIKPFKTQFAEGMTAEKLEQILDEV